MAQFSVDDAKANLSRLIAEALEGGEGVIAQDNVSAVRLVPVASKGRRKFGVLKDKIAMDSMFDDPLPEDEHVGLI